MKNRKNFNSDPGYKGKEQGTSANAGPTVKEPEPVRAFRGQTQENYINPRYLAARMIVSISNMSFAGPWL